VRNRLGDRWFSRLGQGNLWGSGENVSGGKENKDITFIPGHSQFHLKEDDRLGKQMWEGA